MIIEFNGISPEVSPYAFTAEGAKVIGNVTLCEDSSVWFNAVLRGDEAKITVGKGPIFRTTARYTATKTTPLLSAKMLLWVTMPLYTAVQ